MVWLNVALTGFKIASKAIKPIKKALKAKKKTKVKPKTEIKSGKFKQSQFSTTDKDYGHDVIKNIYYKSKKSVKSLEKRMDNIKGQSHLGTHVISKKKFLSALKKKIKD